MFQRLDLFPCSGEKVEREESYSTGATGKRLSSGHSRVGFLSLSLCLSFHLEMETNSASKILHLEKHKTCETLSKILVILVKLPNVYCYLII
jgi:hypothetical protein